MGVYLLFLSNLFLHGLLIWEHPLLRVGGVLMGLLMLAVTVAMIRRGAFAPRVVVELRDDRRPDGQSLFATTAGGQPAASSVRVRTDDGERQIQGATGALPAFGALRSVGVQLPAGSPRELKVWGHTITPDGISEGLEAQVTVQDGDEQRVLDLGRARRAGRDAFGA